MKTAILSKTAYTYNELCHSAKAKAKEDYLTNNSCILGNEFTEDLKNSLKFYFGLENLKTYYSLSYSQGDGLCLYGTIEAHEIFDNPKFRKIALNGLRGGQIKSVKENLYKIEFKHRSNLYYHARSVDIELIEQTYNTTDKQLELISRVETNIENWYFDFCHEWEKQGYSHFYEVDDDTMSDNAKANNLFFDENGVVLYGYEIKEAN